MTLPMSLADVKDGLIVHRSTRSDRPDYVVINLANGHQQLLSKLNEELFSPPDIEQDEVLGEMDYYLNVMPAVSLVVKGSVTKRVAEGSIQLYLPRLRAFIQGAVSVILPFPAGTC